jgi:hypothetical protein
MKSLTRAKAFVVALGLALPSSYLAIGCGSSSGSGGGGTGGGDGTVNLQVTDAPFPFSSVASAKVTVTEVDLQGTTSHGFVTAWIGSQTLDLLQLRNGVTSMLASAQLPAGTYSQVRIVITSGSVTLTDGRTFDLETPSASSAGLKVFISPPLTVVSSVSQDLLLDVDLSQSFEAIPNGATRAADISTFHFHPVVRVSNVSTVGRIQGHVTALTGGAPIAGATVTATMAGAIAGTALSANDGSYAILGLAPGSYDVTGDAVGFVSTTVAAQNVAAGSETTVDLHLGP